MILSKRRAKIVATLGPASQSPEMMRSLLLNGMDVARFNFSHGGPNIHAPHIATLRGVSEEVGRPVAILQDLCGPKIRTGKVAEGGVLLESGHQIILTTGPAVEDDMRIPVTYAALPRDCRRGDTILLDDGLIELHVESTTDTDVICMVVDGGVLKSNKGINLPGVQVSAPALSEKDRHDVEWGLENGIEFVALSFVRRPEDVRELREIVRRHDSKSQIIAKLEKPEAIEQLEEIIEAADGVMVARGDLGVEMPTETVPLLQKRIIQAANDAGKTVITATQMLESMTMTSRPTRAEASDVANAVLDGSDALMLSGETAAGAYPLESVQMMARIIEEVETSANDIWYNYRANLRSQYEERDNFTSAICEAAAHAAAGLKARALVCFTETGYTARRLAKYRPPVPIIAFTPSKDVLRSLKLSWGVQPRIIAPSMTTDEMILCADEALLQSGMVMRGDVVVVTLGAPVALHGSTNLLKLHRVGEADIG